MTNAQDPADADAHRGAAPPPQQPPPYSHEAAVELPGDAPEASSRQNGAEESSPAVEASRITKPEGSSYASSYRPSDIQSNPPPLESATQHHGFDIGQADDSAAGAIPDEPLPAYSEIPGTISEDNNHLGANARVGSDGRVNIQINQKGRALSQLIGPSLQRQLTQVQHEPAPPPPYVPEFLGGAPGQTPPPKLNVVIQVVGSRGDVQPFVSLGKVLKETYGHRVRLATHPTFKDFVNENGLEFFSIGGDPAELMAYMVKNPGLMPGFETLRSGDIGKRRKGIAEILRGTWRSCIETGDGIGVDPVKQSVEEWMGVEDQLPDALKKPFIADAIIANPPSFGHLHIAEKLGIPLHMMFTMPWSPTQQFPHPLANVQSSSADPTITNFMSYILVDMLTWQGLGDLINKFRKDCLGLDPIGMVASAAMLARLRIPWTYCWSPALIPKPKDWGNHIQISGFYFLDLAQNYTPAPELANFLAAGEAPVYIGFGSIVVDDPNAMTKLIFDAVKMTGRRALVSKGWGGLGGDELEVPEGVFMLGNCPHDWLFKQVSAVVHHGGAGTTAAGIAAGRPTVVVPFFGDQPFWGQMTARAGAGPEPIPYRDLTAEKLAGAIQEALKPESLEKAKVLADKISRETGSQNGAQSFHQMLKVDELRCAVAPHQSAVWRVKRTKVVLSAQAATVLAQAGELSFSELKLFRPREYVPDDGPTDPISGGASAIMGTATQMVMGVADFPIETLKLLNVHPESRKGKEKVKEPKEDAGTNLSRTESHTVSELAASAASSAVTLPGVNTPTASSADTRDRSSTDVSREPRPTTPTTPNHRSAFMAQAMAQTGSRSPSRDRFKLGCGPERPRHDRAKSISAAELRSNSGTVTSERSFAEKFNDMNQDSMIGTGKGLGRIVGAGFKSPMDFSLNVAKGFHNVPKLLGSEVRQVDKVTDLQSGLRTAAKEFGFGLYDGIAGIVTDPYKGAKKEGGIGFVKGVGRGLFNVPWRVMGGAMSIPAYAMKGLYQEMQKAKGNDSEQYVIAARISQGYDEASTISPGERADIISRWKCIRLNVKKKKAPGEESYETISNIMAERRKKKRFGKKRAETTPVVSPAVDNSHRPSLPLVFELPHDSHHLSHANTFPQREAGPTAAPPPMEESQRQQMEEVIAGTVAETSRGDPREDELISRAIRASMLELQRGPEAGENEQDMLQRAMNASLQEAQRAGVSEEEQKILEETLRQSMLESTAPHRRRHPDHGTDSEWDSSDTEDDEEYQRILAESKELAHLHQTSSRGEYFQTVTGAPEAPDADADAAAAKEEEEALRKAIEESKAAGATPASAHDAEAEEEAALRQALAESEKTAAAAPSSADADDEEAIRRAIAESEKAAAVLRPGGGGGEDDDEEALRRAIEESERAEREREEALAKQRTEEEIVLEYVKKQSLAEEQMRRRWVEGRDVVGESSGAGGSGSAGGA